MEKVAEMPELLQFIEITQDLLETETVKSMAQWLHHGKVSCLDHSVGVALLSYQWAKHLHLDERAVARAGLLHDLYLYHKRDKTAHPGIQCVDHPRIAAKNAKNITSLSEKEENIILSHMWPFGGPFGAVPKSPEAVLVNTVDTFLAAVEFSGLSKAEGKRKQLYEILS